MVVNYEDPKTYQQWLTKSIPVTVEWLENGNLHTYSGKVEEINKGEEPTLFLSGYKNAILLQDIVYVDAAMKAAEEFVPTGGIDLNARKMGLDVTKDGKGVEIKYDAAMVAEFRRGNFTGVEAFILRITPIQSVLPILGFENPVDDKKLAYQ